MTTAAAAATTTADADASEVAPVGDATGARAAVVSRHDLLALSLVTALWVLPMFFIGLHGSFPLNDDWAYHYSVRHFLSTGQLMRTDWTFVPLVSHTLIGGLFCTPTGFSFESLRLATLFMGWLGIVGLYTLSRQSGALPSLATLAALLLAFNPLYFNLSYTFMTEVPFTAMLVWAVVLCVHALKRHSAFILAAGAMVSIAATLSRQFGVALAGAIALTLVLGNVRSWSRWAVAAAIVVLHLLAYTVIPKLIYGHADLETGAWLASNLVFNEHLPYLAVRRGSASLMYIGLFCLPLTALLLSRPVEPRRQWIVRLAVGVAIAAPVAAVAAFKGWRLPGQNLIFDFGLGPVSTVGEDQLPRIPAWSWWVLSCVGLASAAHLLSALVVHLVRRWQRLPSEPSLVLPLFAAALLLASVAPWRFDRYLVPALPFVLVAFLHPLAGATTARALLPKSLAVAALAVLALFSIAGTRDYLERNRARWDLLDPLVASGVSPIDVNGGFEFNRWFREDLPAETKWEGVEAEPIIVTTREPGPSDVVLATRTYRRLMPFGWETVRLCRRPVPAAPVNPASAATAR